MPKFEIRGKGKNSGRKRKRVYPAANEQEARLLAEDDGTEVEDVTELPADPATERQLAYASGLGISIPADATKADLSDLISIKTDRDKPATARHRKLADHYGVETTQYVGKKALFDRVQNILISPGRENDLLSWFVYRVYRELIHGADDAPIETPNDSLIQRIASGLAKDEKIVKSVRRYRGRELIWFGEWTSPDGRQYLGGSNRTAAYKAASSLLREQLNLSKAQPTPQRAVSSAPSKRSEARSAESRGCLSVVAFALLFPIGVIAAYVILL